MTWTIWVDGWQIQCCGQDFAPGDVVSWTLLEADPADYDDIVGSERAEGIDFREEHHGQEEGCASTLVEVVSIVEVHCRYGALPGSTGNVNHPVPGTAVLVPVEKADGWAKAVPGVGFSGYLVIVRRVTGLPEGLVPRGR